MTQKKIRSHRHAFRFKLENGKVITAWAKVRPATSAVELVLTPAHVKRALALQGQGNTQKCAMAVCSQEHGDAFPHPFEFVDWLYKRAYFVTKTKNGLPDECVAYAHNDNVAPNFDTKAGMQKLLKSLEKNGSRTIRLSPPTYKPREIGRPQGRKTGERQRPIQHRGAALRFARLSLGGVEL